MAQVTGYVCDICSKYAEVREDWLKLTTQAHSPGDKGWDICSNKCLLKLAKERYEVDKPERPKSEAGNDTLRKEVYEAFDAEMPFAMVREMYPNIGGRTLNAWYQGWRKKNGR